MTTHRPAEDPTMVLYLEGHELRALQALVERERQRADGAADFEQREAMTELFDLLDSARPA